VNLDMRQWATFVAVADEDWYLLDGHASTQALCGAHPGVHILVPGGHPTRVAGGSPLDVLLHITPSLSFMTPSFPRTASAGVPGLQDCSDSPFSPRGNCFREGKHSM